jgi:hypothetical protein
MLTLNLVTKPQKDKVTSLSILSTDKSLETTRSSFAKSSSNDYLNTACKGIKGDNSPTSLTKFSKVSSKLLTVKELDKISEGSTREMVSLI